ncbi:hypothetical protein F442_23161 [Phytophthora nicotianae P10297]|uniref:Uncharacterized protein n=2 Tax=Phytophthora nicotianae TaxID=4792 RepID=W2XYF4_PHYNI|nr:hypothetical protein L914_15361 [Phytophthora nicotianae]ETP27562.1 hypothetical protein F442_23161 [Phytophthora nicotianae P10297]
MWVTCSPVKGGLGALTVSASTRQKIWPPERRACRRASASGNRPIGFRFREYRLGAS